MTMPTAIINPKGSKGTAAEAPVGKLMADKRRAPVAAAE